MIGKLTKNIIRMLVDELRAPRGRYAHLLTLADRVDIAHLHQNLQDLTTDAPMEIVPITYESPETKSLVKFEAPEWEYMNLGRLHPTNEAPAVRRLQVPGGYLYQVAFQDSTGKWHPPVFVPASPTPRQVTEEEYQGIVDAARKV